MHTPYTYSMPLRLRGQLRANTKSNSIIIIRHQRNQLARTTIAFHVSSSDASPLLLPPPTFVASHFESPARCSCIAWATTLRAASRTNDATDRDWTVTGPVMNSLEAQTELGDSTGSERMDNDARLVH